MLPNVADICFWCLLSNLITRFKKLIMILCQNQLQGFRKLRNARSINCQLMIVVVVNMRLSKVIVLLSYFMGWLCSLSLRYGAIWIGLLAVGRGIGLLGESFEKA